CGAPSQADLDLVRQTFETNVFGVVAVTNAMLPLMRRSPAPRIVNVSSGLGSGTHCADPALGFSRAPSELLMAYSASKAALNCITIHYATELRATAFKVNAICPGYVATEMTGHKGRPVNEGARII